jgi:hypothetical protein
MMSKRVGRKRKFEQLLDEVVRSQSAVDSSYGHDDPPLTKKQELLGDHELVKPETL